MADRQEPSRRPPERRAPTPGSRQAAPSSSRQATPSGSRQAPPPIRRSPQGQTPQQNTTRRTDTVRCENCGEDYSTTYKRCPFCDERPGRSAAGGKRVSNSRGGGYGAPANPLRVAVLVISLVLIIAAMFIVFRFFSSAIFGGKNGGDASSSGTGSSTSQPDNSSGSGQGAVSQPGGSVSTPDTSSPNTVTPPVQLAPQSISLNKYDMTLRPNEIFQMIATVSPSGVSAPVTWSTGNPNVASVDENGLVTNQNKGTTKTSTVITATCGDVKAECKVFCRPQGGGTTATDPDPDPGAAVNPVTPSGPVAPNSKGTIINAENGLNIRSGPGREHSVVASANNGAEITILGEENGWYHINYGGSNTGYVSKDYVSVKG